LCINLEGPNYLEGRVSGAVFSNESMEEMDIYKEVYAMFAWSNPLWPKLFPGCRKMEAEVVRMCCDLFQGSDETCGTVRLSNIYILNISDEEYAHVDQLM
jgi:sphinganine-1-phosphate aldolase